MTIIEDSGGEARRPKGARVVGGRLAITLGGIDGGEEETVVVRDTIHEKIHEGEFWSAGLLDTALGSGANLDILIQVGATPMHARFEGGAGQNVLAELYEGTTFSVAGTPLAPVARNRANVQAPLVTLTSAPTITLVGTQLFGGFIAGGTGNRPPGGSDESFNEYILAANTVYLARIANTLIAAATVAQLAVEFYESTDGTP